MPRGFGAIPQVELVAWSNIGHLQQLYAGLATLHKNGVIQLRQRLEKAPTSDPDAPPHLRGSVFAHCSVIVNGVCHVYFDMHDSWEINESALHRHHLYFKRSFYPQRFRSRPDLLAKLRPYGMNYEVLADGLDRFALRRSALSSGWREFVRSAVRACGWASLLRFDPAVSKLEADVPESSVNGILFMARAWDPSADADLDPELEPGDIDSERALDRDAINDMRAECIRALRRAFGTHFVGGLAPTRYATQKYPDVVLPAGMNRKSHYLGLLRRSAIGIATAGLQGSLGWKIGEYVAFSRAIVSERIDVALPGVFEAGRNYLPFSTPQECVERVHKLFVDVQARNAMMLANRTYYLDYLHPQRVAARAVQAALDFMGEAPSETALFS